MTDPHSPSSNEVLAAQNGEPTTGSAPVPPWLWILAVVLVAWAALYLGLNSGGFQSDIYDASQVSWAGGGGGPSGPPDPMVVGKRIFSANCVVCHQATGLGVAGQFPPLAASEWVLDGDWHGDNHLVKVLLQGLQGPVEVKGNVYNNAMPAWKQLKDSDIAAVLTYIRNEWGNQAEPITADYVATIRDQTASRSEPWTQAALQAIPGEKIGGDGATPGATEGAAPAEGAPADAPADPAGPAPAVTTPPKGA